MAEDDIVQKVRIEVEGGDKLDEQYKALADAAKKAADEIAKAGTAGGDGFEKATKAVGDAVEQFDKLGEAGTKAANGLTQITEAGSLVGDNFIKIATAGSDVVVGLNKAGEAGAQVSARLGQAGEAGDKIAIAFVRAGTAGIEAADGFTKTGAAVDKTITALNQTGEAGTKAADGVVKVGVAGNTAAEGMDKAAEASTRIAKALDEAGDAGGKITKNLTEAGEAGTNAARGLGDTGEASNKAATGLGEVSAKSTDAKTSMTDLGTKGQDVGAAFQNIGQSAEAAIAAIQRLGVAATTTAEALTQLAPGIKAMVDALTQVGAATESAAVGLGKVSESSQQVVIQITNNNTAVEDGTRFWASYGLEVIKTGTYVADVTSKFADNAIKAGDLGVKILLLAGAFLVLAKAALTPHIQEEANALVKLEIEYRNYQTELAKLALEQKKFDESLKQSTDSALKNADALTKVADAGAKVADAGAKVAESSKETATSLEKTGLEGAKLFESLFNLSKATGKTIGDLQIGKQAFDHIGLSAESFGTTVKNLTTQLKGLDLTTALIASADKMDAANKNVLVTQKALLEAQIKLQEEGGKRAPADAARQLEEVNRKLLALTSDRATAEKALNAATLAAAEAQKAHATAVATSLQEVATQVRNIINGAEGIKFNEFVTAETKIQAVKLALKAVSEQAGATGVSVIQALVQVIAKTTDLKDALAIGKQFGLDEAAVNSIRQYGDQARNTADTLGRIPNLFQKIREGGVAIGPEAAANFDRVNTSVNNLDDASLRLSKAWAALFPPTQALENFKTKSIELAQAQADAIVKQNELKANWINFGAAVVEVGTKIGTTLVRPEFWIELGGKLAEMGGKFGTFFATVGESATKAATSIGGAFSGIGAAFTKLAQDSGFTAMWDNFTERSGTAFENFKQMWSGSALGSMWSTFVSVGQAGFQALSNWWNDKTPGFFDKFIGSFQQSMSSLGTGLEVVGAALSRALTPAWVGFVEQADKATTVVEGFFSRLGTSIGSWASETWGNFSKIFVQTLSDMATAVKQWADSVGLTAFFNRISEEAKAMWDAVGGFFSEIGNAVVKLSADIGLTDIFKSIIGSLDRAKAAVDAWLDSVAAHWYASWAELADFVAKVLGAIGLTGLSDRVKAIADGWRASGNESAKAVEDANKRIIESNKQVSSASGAAAKDYQKTVEAVSTETTKSATAAADTKQKNITQSWDKASEGPKTYKKNVESANQVKFQTDQINNLRTMWSAGVLSLEDYKRRLEDLKIPTGAGGAEELKRMWQAGTISLEAYKSKLAGLSDLDKATSGKRDQIRQMWQDGVISLDEYGRKMKDLDKISPANAADLRNMWKSGLISISEYSERLQQLDKVKIADPAALRQQFKDGVVSADEYKRKLDEIERATERTSKQPTGDPFKTMQTGAETTKQKIEEIPAAAERTASTVGKSSAAAAENLTKPLTQAATAAGKEIEKTFNQIKPDFKGVVAGAEAAAAEAKRKLADIKPAPPPPEPPPAPKADPYQQLMKAFEIVTGAIHAADDALLEFNAAASPETAQRLKDAVAALASTLPGLTKLSEPFKDLPDVKDKMKDIKDGIVSIVDDAGAALATMFKPASLSAEEAAGEAKKAFSDINLSEAIKPVEWSDIGKGAKDAAESIKTEFASIDLKDTDFSKALDFDGVVSAAQDAADQIAEAFGSINLSDTDFTNALDFEQIISDAEDAASQIEDTFSNINISSSLGMDFSTITSAAEQAAQQVQQTFSSIDLSSIDQVRADFSGVINSAMQATEQIKLAFQTVGGEGFGLLVAAAQQAFSQISQTASTAAQGIAAAFNVIDFSGLIAQINNVISAFQAMESAANAAAAAANAAASAASSARAAGGAARGGLFRGLPGVDQNLVWLSDMEFIMRPEAVARYGIRFMDMINSLQFPTTGFRDGGLNRIAHSISGFRDGGLFNPRAIVLPAFQAGGLNEGDARAGGMSNLRPLSITIGVQSFDGLLAPEDTAKSLERAAVGRQISATARARPRWNK